jgi:hypothetical protein
MDRRAERGLREGHTTEEVLHRLRSRGQ